MIRGRLDMIKLLSFRKFNEFKSNQISLFLTQLQLQQNELKLNTQNAQLKAGKKKI